ncbi:L,D-peptidoglycan transpeptidase YkuD (ErfK/YbiS/YcfS/YnhG family) [Pseudoxanthomonas japonensis]|uniref:L,D-transpeptidase family protein n=1 Tax=Pseudoxanthomonas japonensis TaxID=69284 RepID=UPI00285877C2|nr:L,D-transpeptidase family protein [Pseudoxanthomonas japonensis]MDR7068537.1 L,D-peptidoglycan transpeptidase YkuD (ErfK/YbiS/YcfS/YnhG family) [Pseudoxanthomonas japonensis]
MPALQFRHRASRLLALVAVMASSFSTHAVAADTNVAAAHAWRDARQMVLVVTDGWDATTGTLQRFELRDGHWQPASTAAPVSVGRNGAAWGMGLHPAQAQGPQKQEGDGRAPAGVFTLGEAFGYADKVDTAMPYRPMHATSYCIDVPDSPLYNRIINTREEGEAAAKGSTEPMRLDLRNDGDPRYREGLVIGHNPKATPRAGSCIFAHLWRTPGEATAGCTAMASETMKAVLAWLAPDARPVFVLLPRDEYSRVMREWQLPEATR